MKTKSLVFAITVASLASVGIVGKASAAPVPGGTLDPTTIPKYVTPLVIPPVMPSTSGNHYDIAVRQFPQQILPNGFPATTVWSYGPEQDTTPALAPDVNGGSRFNYPAFTIENTNTATTYVNWYNELVVDPDACKANPGSSPACNHLPHLLPIDRSLHWANPEKLPCASGTARVTDCRPDPNQLVDSSVLQQPYAGPVPIVTHVHGAHVGPESDGYPEAWWLPDANDIPMNYATMGSLANMYDPLNPNTAAGVAKFTYPNSQPSTTLWYHDHTLGMTRSNVYAGPAGFWLIRDPDAPVGSEDGLVSGTLPGPAPVSIDTLADLNGPTATKRAKIREIPIVIQGRSFNADGSLFYPNQRAFFQELRYNQLNIPFIGDPTNPSDISAIWNPEAFFNVMVVNGVSWPKMEVEPDLYRFRLLNGCNSRFLNLSLVALDSGGLPLGEVPFYQIGAEQGLLPRVVEVKTGFKTVLPGPDPVTGIGIIPPSTSAAAPEEALLMGLAERADVIVDFSRLPPGTVRVRMLNTGPDAPFGGFPAVPLADPGTTGQVMEFVLVSDGPVGDDPDFGPVPTLPENLALSLPDSGDIANQGVIGTPRDLALLEEESISVCVKVTPNGQINYDKHAAPDPLNPGTCTGKNGRLAHSVPMAPKAAVLGVVDPMTGVATPTLWADTIQTTPVLGSAETWALWNQTVDAHPIHLHLVKFKVVNREAIDPATGFGSGTTRGPELTEAGWKDTVIAYPGEITRVNATFDIAGLYVWHCHIVEHEDNEMMVPFCVDNGPGCAATGQLPPPAL